MSKTVSKVLLMQAWFTPVVVKLFEEDSGSQKLVLQDGTRYQSDAKNEEFRAVAFDKYYIQIQDQKVEHARRKLSALPTSQLMTEQSPEANATIHWRVGFPVSVFDSYLSGGAAFCGESKAGQVCQNATSIIAIFSLFLIANCVAFRA